MNPLVKDLSQLTDEQLENKISDILKKLTIAMQVQPNAVIPLQNILENYNMEKQARMFRQIQEMEEKDKSDPYAPLDIGEMDDGDNQS